MRVWIVLMIIILNMLIQSTVLQHIRILDVIPNTALLLVVSFSILWGRRRAAIIGFSIGILQDIAFGWMIGMNAFIYMLIGYYVGALEKNIYKDNYVISVIFTLAATVMYHVVYFVFMIITRHTVSFVDVFRKIILLEMIYNSVVSILVYRLLYRLSIQPSMKIKIR